MCAFGSAGAFFEKMMSAVREIFTESGRGHEEKEAVETKVTLGGKVLDRIFVSKNQTEAKELSAVGPGGSRN